MRDEPAAPNLLYLVKQLELAVRSRLDEVLRPVAMTSLQYTALTVLERRAMTTAELARNSFVTDQSMAGMVAVLEARGVIDRRDDPADRRRRVIVLTAAGRDLLDRFRAPVAAIEADLLAGFGAAEAEALRHLLLRGHASLTGRDAG